MYEIEVNALVGICEAARIWFHRMNEICHTFEREERQAAHLRDYLFEYFDEKSAVEIISEEMAQLITETENDNL